MMAKPISPCLGLVAQAVWVACFLPARAAELAPSNDLKVRHTGELQFELRDPDDTVLADCWVVAAGAGGVFRPLVGEGKRPPVALWSGRGDWGFAGVLSAGDLRVEAEGELAREGAGLRLTLALAASEALSGVAVRLRLPVATWAGGQVRLGGLRVPLDAKPGKLLATAETDLLELSRGRRRLVIGRSAKSRIEIRDLRLADGGKKADAWEVRISCPSPAGGRCDRFALRLAPAAGPPAVCHWRLLSPELGPGGRQQAVALVLAPGANPFDWNEVSVSLEITGPEGKKTVVPAFYERRLAGAGPGEALLGEGRFRAQWRCGEPGRYGARVVVNRGNEKARSDTRSYLVTGKPLPGKVVVRGRFLARENGSVFLPVGVNWAFPASFRRLEEWEARLPTLSQHGINLVRLWTCTWGLNLEGSDPQAFDLPAAARLERLLERLEENGMYAILCLDNAHDLRFNKDRSPYFFQLGGPCRESRDFFTHPAAKARYQRKLAYVASRFSAYRSLLCYELFNELSYALEAPTPARQAELLRRQVLEPWALEMGRYLKNSAPEGTLVSISLGNDIVWPRLWRESCFDLILHHAYLPPTEEILDPVFFRSWRVCARAADALRPFGKPALMSEFGFQDKTSPPQRHQRDPEGVHVHNALWGAAMSGLAGSSLHWWWDSYLEKHRLWRHHEALARFLSGVTLPPGTQDATWSTLRSSESAPLDLYGLKTDRSAHVWVVDPASNWLSVLKQPEVKPQIWREMVVRLPNLRMGQYRVIFYDPWKGAECGCATLVHQGEKLTVELPPFSRDIAFHVTPK